MHNKFKWLQLFADGTDGGDGAAASGVDSPAAAGQDTGVDMSAAAGQTEAKTMADRLTELGVPAGKLNRAKYNKKAAAKQPEVAQQAAAVENTEEVPPVETAPQRLTWDEIMADPEYNAEMNKVITARLSKVKPAVDGLEKLAPALEMLSKKYGIETGNYDALNQAVINDDAYYEERALEMGVSPDVVKQLESANRMVEAAQQQQQQFINEQKLHEHLAKLNQQAIALREKYPDFDLRKELDNPTFRRMTAPDLMFSLEDAYELVHRDEIKANIKQAALQASKEQLSKAMQANKTRPSEGGAARTNNASVGTFDYRTATKEQREALKARIRAGEIIYPGQL